MERHNIDAAFATVEQARAAGLKNLLTERRLFASRPTNPTLIKHWDAYRRATVRRDRAFGVVSSAVSGEAKAKAAVDFQQADRTDPATVTNVHATYESASAHLAAARSSYLEATQEVRRQWQALQRSDPRAFVEPTDPATARRAIPAGSLFVAYSCGPEETILFLIGASGPTRAYPIPISRAALEQRVSDLRRDITAHHTDRQPLDLISRDLFNTLFPGEARLLVLAARSLIIAPDGPLWELPFTALVTNAAGPPAYLGLAKPLVSAPSLTLFALASAPTRAPANASNMASSGLHSRGRSAGQPHAQQHRLVTALVVGDPVFGLSDANVSDAKRMRAGPPRMQVASAPTEPGISLERSHLWGSNRPPAPLPATRREAQSIARLYSATPLLGKDATESSVRKQLPSVDVIHLATHGFLMPYLPMSSGLLLTPGNAPRPPSTTSDDGALQAWEIFSQLRLRADLAVLSACDTARGRIVSHEGVIGLARALHYAGVRTVVTSQWKVADVSSADLMIAFHRRVRNGIAKADALRAAMETVYRRRETSHPYYWSGFVLSGDPGPLRAHPN